MTANTGMHCSKISRARRTVGGMSRGTAVRTARCSGSRELDPMKPPPLG